MIAKYKILSISMLAAFSISSCAFGATVGAGTFNISGTVVGSTTGLDFYLNTNGDQTATINLPTSGAFGSLTAGTAETIKNLTAGEGVIPGTTFDFQNWIVLSDGINLDITSIPLSPSLPVCSSSASEAIGYQCVANAASPVVLTQTGTGVAANLDVYGVAHFAGDTTDYTPFTGLFTSPSTSYATIASFETAFDNTGGNPPISYSASFTTTVVPEPEAFGLVSIALLGFGLFRWKGASRSADKQ